MTRVRSAAVFGLTVAFPCALHAQPQDDAALADAPEEGPRGKNLPGSPWPSLGQSRGPVSRREAEPEPTLTTEELKQQFPDLELRDRRPPTITVGLASIYPFQSVALLLGFDAYVLPRLRLSGVTQLGAAPDANQNWQFSVYADAAVAVVLVAANSQTHTSVPVGSQRTPDYRSKRSTFERFMFGEEPPPTMRAQVPSAHSVELVAGAFTGLYPLYRCTANCDEDSVPGEQTKGDASRQTTFLYAGLRYVYYRSASSKRAHFRNVGAFETEVDALTNPFTPHDQKVFNLYENHPSYNPVGVRVKLRLPPIQCGPHGTCMELDLMGGYLPSPADGIFAVNILIR